MFSVHVLIVGSEYHEPRSEHCYLALSSYFAHLTIYLLVLTFLVLALALSTQQPLLL
jgi:hypothetical protein